MKDKIKNFFINLYQKIKTYFLKKITELKRIIKSTSDDLSIIDIEEGRVRYSLNWWFMKSLKWLIAAVLAVFTLFLWGCSGTVVTKYYPVSVPVSCNVQEPLKPEYNENLVVTNLNILAYAEKLQSALKVCKNGGFND